MDSETRRESVFVRSLMFEKPYTPGITKPHNIKSTTTQHDESLALVKSSVGGCLFELP